jgi:hypothetical protein
MKQTSQGRYHRRLRRDEANRPERDHCEAASESSRAQAKPKAAAPLTPAAWKCPKPVLNCSEGVLKCAETVLKCSEGVLKCTETVLKCSERVLKCSETVSKCSETVLNYSECVLKCSDSVSKCTERVSKCTERVLKCSEKFYDISRYLSSGPCAWAHRDLPLPGVDVRATHSAHGLLPLTGGPKHPRIAANACALVISENSVFSPSPPFRYTHLVPAARMMPSSGSRELLSTRPLQEAAHV